MATFLFSVGPGRALAGGPTRDRRAVTSPGVVKNLKSDVTDAGPQMTFQQKLDVTDAWPQMTF